MARYKQLFLGDFIAWVVVAAFVAVCLGRMAWWLVS